MRPILLFFTLLSLWSAIVSPSSYAERVAIIDASLLLNTGTSNLSENFVTNFLRADVDPQAGATLQIMNDLYDRVVIVGPAFRNLDGYSASQTRTLSLADRGIQRGNTIGGAILYWPGAESLSFLASTQLLVDLLKRIPLPGDPERSAADLFKDSDIITGYDLFEVTQPSAAEQMPLMDGAFRIDLRRIPGLQAGDTPIVFTSAPGSVNLVPNNPTDRAHFIAINGGSGFSLVPYATVDQAAFFVLGPEDARSLKSRFFDEHFTRGRGNYHFIGHPGREPNDAAGTVLAHERDFNDDNPESPYIRRAALPPFPDEVLKNVQPKDIVPEMFASYNRLFWIVGTAQALSQGDETLSSLFQGTWGTTPQPISAMRREQQSFLTANGQFPHAHYLEMGPYNRGLALIQRLSPQADLTRLSRGSIQTLDDCKDLL